MIIIPVPTYCQLVRKGTIHCTFEEIYKVLGFSPNLSCREVQYGWSCTTKDGEDFSIWKGEGNGFGYNNEEIIQQLFNEFTT